MSPLTVEESVDLLRRTPTTELMARADRICKSRHNTKVHYVHSLNLNPTNLCVNRCPLCAFWKERGDSHAYTLSLDQIEEKMRQARDFGLTDLHVVGGLNEELNLDYYADIFRMAKQILPGVAVQGLTAVEIFWLAEREGMDVSEVLEVLKEAGLDALPGGGAEIFDPDIRRRICPRKISADQWLEVHRRAHRLGMPTNATMLFGHIESDEHIVSHLFRLRDLQAETGGFLAFCPLPFHVSGTQLTGTQTPGGDRIVRIVALARIILESFPHIRVLANYLDRKLLQTLLFSGADDVGGTSIDEQIARAAGARDESRFGSPEEIDQFIRALDLKPVRDNSLYGLSGNLSRIPSFPFSPARIPESYGQILQKAEEGVRLLPEEIVTLYEETPFQDLGRIANLRRHQKLPGRMGTFIIDRNISFTNVCTIHCRFCAFHKSLGSDGAFVLSVEEIVEKVQEAAQLGATQIMLQGGLNPALDLTFYETMLRQIKRQVPGIWLHSLSPAEIFWLAERSGLTIAETLKRLRTAGLDSLPGGGAEILSDEVRQRVSPRKLSVGQWLEVMETAQQLGMSTTATMVYGMGETIRQRVEHWMRIRELQDRAGGFRAFIPWSFQSSRTQLEIRPASGVEYLRMVALSRLALDNIDHIQAGWVTEGPDMVELALGFGADDFGGVLMEESVVKATGISFQMTVESIVRRIRQAGLTPAVRDTLYNILKVYES